MQGRLCSGGVVLAGLDNLVEGGLERGTTDEETVDVLHPDEFISVGIADGTTVKNSHRVGSLLGDIGGEPLSDLSVRLLSNLGRGSLAGADSPDGLVGNDDLGPVLAHLSDGVELSSVDLLGSAGLSLIEELTNTGEDGHAAVDSDLGLVGDILVGLTEESSSLGVTGESPGDTHILDHLDGELTSVGTVAGEGEVLGGDVDVVADNTLDVRDVQGSGGDDNINLSRVELKLVKDLSGELLGELDSAIALPVASDQQFSRNT
jgi:hypothetical protein